MMKQKLSCAEVKVGPYTLYHTGPPLDLGPLPSFFYFSLSGPDSLCLDPFNQPVQFLHGQMIRVFSMTLPGHENNLPPTEAIALWADDYTKHLDPIGTFLDELEGAVEMAVREKFVDPHKMGVGGLSRGGFIALHAAAREPRFKCALAFAPITRLHQVKEFEALQDHPLIRSLDTMHLCPSLTKTHIRLYIGNRDVLVDTRASFDFVMAVVEEAHRQQVRSPPIEFFLHPAIGHKGHGTPLEIFRQGADWIASCLK